MEPEQNPSNMGPAIARKMPIASTIAWIGPLLQKYGEQIPANWSDVARLLGMGNQGQAPTYRNDQPLPRHGGTDAKGNPIIIPPQDRFYR